MATKSRIPKLTAPANLSTQQMQVAIPKLKRRIVELQSVDPTTISSRGEPRFDALVQKIDDTLIEIFGNSSVEYDRYSIDSLDTASVSFFGEGTPLSEIRAGYRRGIEQALSNLQTIVELFQEKLSDETPDNPHAQKNAKATTFDIRAAVARLSSRTVERSDSIYAIELAVNQFNEYLKAAKDKYLDSIDIQGLLAFSALHNIKPAYLRDAIARLLEGLDALPDEAVDDSPTLSQKFGILRADAQLGADFSAYENDSGGLGLLFFDIDHFKALNTKYTETVVDQFVLVPFQHLLIEIIQSRGFVYSVGGDEFLLLLRNVDPSETRTFADRLLDNIRKHTFSVNGAAETLTLSVGVACYPSDAKTHFELRKLANTAENKAKQEGRNRVVCTSF